MASALVVASDCNGQDKDELQASEAIEGTVEGLTGGVPGGTMSGAPGEVP